MSTTFERFRAISRLSSPERLSTTVMSRGFFPGGKGKQ
jgi:hypothetical protein